MKLRVLVIVLLLANALMGAWQLGWLDSLFGAAARSEREPSRVFKQVRPQAIGVMPLPAEPAAPSGAVARAGARGANPTPTGVGQATPGAAAAAATTAASAAGDGAAAPGAAVAGGGTPPGAGLCLDAGPFSEAQIETAEQSLRALPAGSWRRVTVEKPAVFGVVMGPFASVPALRAKAAELERLGVKFERMVQPQADGTPTPNGSTILVLAKAPARGAAEAAQKALLPKGVRTAKVVPISPLAATLRLRAEGLTEAQAQSLRSAGSGIEGRGFSACPAS